MITESIHYNLHETLKAYDLRLNILYQEKGEKGLIWLNVLVSSPGHTFHHIFRFSNSSHRYFSPISALCVFQKLKSDSALAFSMFICSHFSSLPLLIQIGFFHVQLFIARTLSFEFVHWPSRCNVQLADTLRVK